MPRTRPERSAVRADVVAAARELFAELGYHRASLDLIASRAGYSKGAVYSNFESKDELFLELLAGEIVTMSDSLVTGDTASGDLDADLHQFAAGLLALAQNGSAQLTFAEFRAHAARVPTLALRLGEVRGVLVDATARRLETEVARHGLELAISAHDAATVLLTLSNGLALEQVGNPATVISVDSLAVVLRSMISVPRHPSIADLPE